MHSPRAGLYKVNLLRRSQCLMRTRAIPFTNKYLLDALHCTPLFVVDNQTTVIECYEHRERSCS